MRSEVDKIPLAEQKWKVIISGGFLLFSALVVVSFFSSTFDFGDEVILYFLSVTTGANWWRPCESPRAPTFPCWRVIH